MQAVKKTEMKKNNTKKTSKRMDRGKKERKRMDRERSIMAPVSVGISSGVQRPNIYNTGKMCIVKHREYIYDIGGTTLFTRKSALVLNPGIKETFPWLSKIGANWEQYSFQYLKFEYIPRCSTSTSGSVMFAPDYDSMDTPPESKAVALTYADSVEDSAWKNICCNLEKRSLQPMGPKKYVRDGNVVGDLKTYDGGELYVCTQGQVDESIIGDIWVSYEVHFFVPQTESAPGSTKCTNLYNSGTHSFPDLFNWSPLKFASMVSNPLRIGIASDHLTFTPPRGTYLLQFTCTFQGAGGAEMGVEACYAVNGARRNNTIVVAETYSSFPGSTPNIMLTCQHVYSFSGTDTLQVQCRFGGAITSANQYNGQLTFLVV